MNAVLSGRDTVLLMPTAGGKSLCFHVPALMKLDNGASRYGLTLVVSPLLSLMHDQVCMLRELGVNAVALSSDTPRDEAAKIRSLMKALHQPSSAKNQLENDTSEPVDDTLKLVYVTPERITKSKLFMSSLEKVFDADHLRLIVIDEVHCVSRWGRTFRQDYQHLSMLKAHFPNVPFLCLTATATPKVVEDIKSVLNLRRCVELKSPVHRSNLFYATVWKPPKHDEVLGLLVHFIRLFPARASGIVYCLTRNDAQQICTGLIARGISAGYYHGDLPQAERMAVYTAWKSGTVQVVVATVAFGMGIHKEDVRFVVHHTLPKSVDAFYQESGRAGRDGHPAVCLLLYRSTDVPRQSTMVYWEPSGLSLLYHLISTFCVRPQLAKEDPSHHGCRHRCLAEAFGCEEKTVCCNAMCDCCFYSSSRRESQPNVTSHPSKRPRSEDSHSPCIVDHEAVQEVLRIMYEAETQHENKYTIRQLASAWRKRLKNSRSSLVSNSMVVDVERLMDLCIQLITLGYAKEDFGHTPYSTNSYCVLTPRGLQLLEGSENGPILSLLPASCWTVDFNIRECESFYDHVFPPEVQEQLATCATGSRGNRSNGPILTGPTSEATKTSVVGRTYSLEPL